MLRVQISRLLEHAAAMSSAQEKVTGNPRLDMAGVMAALAMARQEELKVKTAGGQRSFLHSKYKTSDGLVRAECVQTSLQSYSPACSDSAVRAECVHTSLQKDSQACSDSPQLAAQRGATNVTQSDDSSARFGGKKVSDCRAAFENMNGKNSQSSISSSSSSLESSPGQEKKFSSVLPLKSSLGVAKYLRQANNECEGKIETVGVRESDMRGDVGGNTSGDLTDNMSGFLTVVERLSSEKESRTGNGKLDMSELVEALKNFQAKPPSTPASVPASAPASTPAIASSPVPVLAPSSVEALVKASVKASGGSPPPLPARPPPLIAGGPPRPPPPPLSPPLSAPLSKPASVRRQEKTSSQPEHVKTINTSKYSFQNPHKHQQHATSDTQQPNNSYCQEKHSLIGELKSKINNEGNPVEDFKSNGPRRNLQVAGQSQDQIVKKIVYSQYREMLNSYRNNK